MPPSVHFNDDPVSQVVQYDSSPSASESPLVSTPPAVATAPIPSPKAINLFVNPSLSGPSFTGAVHGVIPDEELSDLGNVSATEPPVGELTITGDWLPGSFAITSQSPSGILSALEVIQQIRNFLRQPVADDEYQATPHRSSIDLAFQRRVEGDTAEYNNGVRRVDFLMGRVITGIHILSDGGGAKLLLRQG